MIGVFDFTVILTYLSLLSASCGIFVSLSGSGHPYWGMLCLLFCGLCDSFDGMVARKKKDRTQLERNFGIQIDSLSDLVAFGVLPACIGAALLRVSPTLGALLTGITGPLRGLLTFLLHAILALYILAAMIRLAYFNVTEEERQSTEGGKRKYYTGLPVTMASLILPAVLMLNYALHIDLAPCYFLTLLIVGLCFLLRFRVKKPGLKGILFMVGIGVAEILVFLLAKWL